MTLAESHTYVIKRQGFAKVSFLFVEIKILRDIYYVLGFYWNIVSIEKLINFENIASFYSSTCVDFTKTKTY